MEDQVELKRKYFWLVIVGAGSSSIWLAILIASFSCFRNFDWTSLPLNFTTYYLGILVAGCIDRGLMLFEDGVNRPRAEFMRIILILGITFVAVLVTVLFTLHANHIMASVLSAIGVYGGLRIWWNVHIRSRQNPAINILGGEIPTRQ